MKQDNLTAKQKDYAVFLPAISSFYAGYIGKEKHGVGLDPGRLPTGIGNMEGMNWLNAQEGLFPYKWSLYSAGHANLDLNKFDPKEAMIRERDPDTIMLADSGGFQIAKGVWPADWTNPNDKEAEKKRRMVLEWQMGIATYGMTMDIPTWTFRDPKAAEASNIRSYEDAVNATQYNNEYWIKNREGDLKILNVLQGGNHAEADHWYDLMKDYCDPDKYDRPFDGWGMGGQNMCDVHLILKRLVTLIHDGLLEPGQHDWMHFLGTSKLEWAVLLTVIQRAVRKYVNPDFTISFDCASPFLATANGQVYHEIVLPHDGKWSYRMNPIVDDKKYSTDTRPYGQAVVADGFVDKFDESPISQHLQMKDICYYKPGDLNKIGKEGKTSWDSFSYALLMGHNVWLHLESVQRANREFDAGSRPKMMWDTNGDHTKFEDIVEAIFATPDRAEAEAIIESYDRYWMDIVGTRGFKGKKAKNARTQFNNLFEVVDEETESSVQSDEEELSADNLTKLEQTVL